MDKEQIERYGRHINLPQVGVEGQEKLLSSCVLIVGMGGLGSPIAMYLAASGVGKLILADFDQVELSNLQRQIAHTTPRIGQLKTHSAKTACLELNPGICIETIDYTLDEEDLDSLIKDVDLVIEGSDNFPTRFAVNTACVRNHKPLVSGAAIRFDGQVSVFFGYQQDAPCYRCLYKGGSEMAETCAITGVLAPLVGIIGTVQAMEAVKILMEIGEPLKSRLLLLDGLTMQWQEIKLAKDPKCPVCSS